MSIEDRLQTIEHRLDAIEETLRTMATETLTWLDIDDAAAYLRVSERTMRRAVAASEIKAYRVGGRRDLRFRREDLDKFMEPA